MHLNYHGWYVLAILPWPSVSCTAGFHTRTPRNVCEEYVRYCGGIIVCHGCSALWRVISTVEEYHYHYGYYIYRLMMHPTVLNILWYPSTVLDILHSTGHPPQYWTSSKLLNVLQITVQMFSRVIRNVLLAPGNEDLSRQHIRVDFVLIFRSL